MSAEKPTDGLIGKTIGQYEILEEVGRGGMATVYRGRQKSMNRIVALKVLPRHFLHDPGFYERFEREVDVISHLEHPHILPIYDYGQDEGLPYIVMRFLAGGSMEQLIRRGTRPLDELEKPLRQVAQALDHAHQQGIIHRDLKPGNIMLDESGNAYLSDFGIARVLGSEMTGSMIIGTPAYMSPEQANGIAIDSRSDIYALGVVLFELITGREPYQAETPMAVLLKHINEPIPPITQYRDDIPDGVEEVIIKATAKDPKDRFASAGEMAKAFSGALRGEPSIYDSPTRAAPPAGATKKAPPTPSKPIPIVTAPAATDPTMQPLPAAPVKSRSPIGLIVGALVLLAVIIGVMVVASGALDQDNTPIAPTPVVNAVPTPFFRAETVDDDLYSISIPQAWIPPQGYIDNSDTNRLVHIWQDDNLTTYIALVMVDSSLATAEQFAAAVDAYSLRYYETNSALTLIDEAAAPDGTIRRSYRLQGETNPQFSVGQTDVYFLNRAPYLVVLETYAADSQANTLITTFQNILDSLRVKAQS